MNILCIGDIVGNSGCEFLRRKLPELKRKYSVDFCIVNGENSAEGNGITPYSAEHIFASGADVITGGNHTLRRREVYETLEENEFLLRPANLPDAVPGRGMCIADLGHTKIAVINLIGTVYMDGADCPFHNLDKMVEKAKDEGAKIIIVDFHAEATSEKRALGLYSDGKVTAFFGTHTHVQTNDSVMLPEGTAYVTDIGMTGPIHSVLGVKPEIVITRMKDKIPGRFMNAEGKASLSGWLLSVERDGRVTDAQLINVM